MRPVNDRDISTRGFLRCVAVPLALAAACAVAAGLTIALRSLHHAHMPRSRRNWRAPKSARFVTCSTQESLVEAARHLGASAATAALWAVILGLGAAAAIVASRRVSPDAVAFSAPPKRKEPRPRAATMDAPERDASSAF